MWSFAFDRTPGLVNGLCFCLRCASPKFDGGFLGGRAPISCSLIIVIKIVKHSCNIRSTFRHCISYIKTVKKRQLHVVRHTNRLETLWRWSLTSLDRTMSSAAQCNAVPRAHRLPFVKVSRGSAKRLRQPLRRSYVQKRLEPRASLLVPSLPQPLSVPVDLPYTLAGKMRCLPHSLVG